MAARQDPTVRWRLRGYVVEQLLGSGASAEVWRARVAATGERVALKRILVRDAEQVRQAHGEAALLSALDHPSLVRLHAVVASEDSIVLVLDLAEHGSLRDLLAARGRLTPGELITALAPVAAAVSYLHSQSVVHGDVAAGNILFTEAGTPLLGDVGVARLTGDDRDAESTPLYIDPAVAAGAVPGPASDLFMLGAVAFHALTGVPLWRADTPDLILALAARGVPADVEQQLAAAGVPAGMVAAVVRALAPDPHRRGSPVGFALDLRHGATPVAIEFAAGRQRPEPRRLELPDDAPDEGWARLPAPSPDPLPAPSADPSRPEFERPGPAAAPPGQEPPTRMVAPRPRPTIPRHTHRRAVQFGGRLAGARVMLLGAGLLVLGTGAAVAATRFSAGDATSGADGGSGRVVTASGRVTSGVARQTVPAASPGAGSTTVPSPALDPPSSSAAQVGRWTRVLGDLDAVRAEAYAARNPHLLRNVYAAGTLLANDTAQLARLVPAGCGLTGALTTYSQVSAQVDGARAALTVTAALPPTRLVCGGTTRSAAAGTGRVRLRIDVVQTASGPRIAAEQRV